MLEQREMTAAIVAIVVTFYLLANRGKVASVPRASVLVFSFVLLAASLACSVAENLLWEETFDLCQHALSAASLVFLAIWSWLVFVRKDGVST